MANENNQDLIKIVQDSQKNQRWMTISMGLSTVASLIATFTLIWNTFKRNKSSLATRMRRNRAMMARLKLEMVELEKEAEHEIELNQLKSGLGSLENLKEKGEEIVQDQADQVKKVVEGQIKDAKDKLKDKFFKKE